MPLRQPRDRGETDAGNRHHVERRRMMLGDVGAIEAGRVGGGEEFETLVVLRGERPVGAVDVIEKTDFHCASLDIKC